MTKEQILKRAKDIAKHNLDRCIESDEGYGITCAMDMANWLLRNIQIVNLHNAYNHDLFDNRKFLCLEEQKKQLLMSLKDYIKVEEELTDYRVVVKMKIEVIK